MLDDSCLKSSCYRHGTRQMSCGVGIREHFCECNWGGLRLKCFQHEFTHLPLSTPGGSRLAREREDVL